MVPAAMAHRKVYIWERGNTQRHGSAHTSEIVTAGFCFLPD